MGLKNRMKMDQMCEWEKGEIFCIRLLSPNSFTNSIIYFILEQTC